MRVGLLSPFYRGGNRGPQPGGALPKAAWPVGGRTSSETAHCGPGACTAYHPPDAAALSPGSLILQQAQPMAGGCGDPWGSLEQPPV